MEICCTVSPAAFWMVKESGSGAMWIESAAGLYGLRVDRSALFGDRRAPGGLDQRSVIGDSGGLAVLNRKDGEAEGVRADRRDLDFDIVAGDLSVLRVGGRRKQGGGCGSLEEFSAIEGGHSGLFYVKCESACSGEKQKPRLRRIRRERRRHTSSEEVWVGACIARCALRKPGGLRHCGCDGATLRHITRRCERLLVELGWGQSSIRAAWRSNSGVGRQGRGTPRRSNERTHRWSPGQLPRPTKTRREQRSRVWIQRR